MKPSVLIIEDNAFLSELYQIAFTSDGFEVAAERSGLGGKNLALTWKPDFILLDLMMPDLDGLSILRDIRHQLPDTKIIMCSNLSLSQFKKEAMALGANLVLEKSQFTPLEIVTEIKKNFDE